MRGTIGLWILIIVFSFGLCVLTGFPIYWLTNDKLIAQIVGTTFGVVGIIAAYKVWERFD